MEITKTINGKNYRYLKIGSGSKNLLFLYGLMSYKENFVNLITRSFSGYTTLIPEYPYHNDFFDLDVNIASVTSIVEYLVPLIEEEILCDAFDVIGFSLGGLIALELANSQKLGEKIRKTVVWASPIMGRRGLTSITRSSFDLYRGAGEEKVAKLGDTSAVRGLLLKRGIKPLLPAILKDYLKAVESFSLSLGVRNTLFVYDPMDTAVSTNNAEYLQECIKGEGIEVVEIRGGGHFGTKEGWKRTIERIEEFLNPRMSTTEPDSRVGRCDLGSRLRRDTPDLLKI